jgi:hypothetical protein
MRMPILDPGSCQPCIRDGKNQIRDKHPGSATLQLLDIIATTEIQREIMNKNDSTLKKISPAMSVAPFQHCR